LINRIVKDVVKEFIGISDEIGLIPDDAPYQDQTCTHFCMARPTKYDVMLQGRKIAGAAQRKTKDGFLHQGTIALLRPDEKLLSAVLPSAAVREAMMTTTFPLLSDQKNLEEGRRKLCEQLKRHFTKL
jgi:lipoate-protein ligase A